MIHAMEAWAKVLAIKDNSWCKKVLRLIRLLYPSEIQFDSYPTKSQSDWMCVIYS